MPGTSSTASRQQPVVIHEAAPRRRSRFPSLPKIKYSYHATGTSKRSGPNRGVRVEGSGAEVQVDHGSPRGAAGRVVEKGVPVFDRAIATGEGPPPHRADRRRQLDFFSPPGLAMDPDPDPVGHPPGLTAADPARAKGPDSGEPRGQVNGAAVAPLGSGPPARRGSGHQGHAHSQNHEGEDPPRRPQSITRPIEITRTSPLRI